MSSFGVLAWSLVGTLEQRRAELFALAAFLAAVPALPLPPFQVRAQAGGERVYKGRKEEEEDGTGKTWRTWCKGGLPLAGALVGAWAVLGGG